MTTPNPDFVHPQMTPHAADTAAKMAAAVPRTECANCKASVQVADVKVCSHCLTANLGPCCIGTADHGGCNDGA